MRTSAWRRRCLLRYLRHSRRSDSRCGRPSLAPSDSGAGGRRARSTLPKHSSDPSRIPAGCKNSCSAGLIALIPLLGALICQGYAWLYCRRVISRNFALPEWDDWGEMLSRGFGVFVIGLVYAIVPLLVGLLLGLAGGGMSTWMRDPAAAVTALFGGCLVPLMVVLVMSLFCFFFYPMSLTRYAGTGDFGAAFEFGRLWDVISANFSRIPAVLPRRICRGRPDLYGCRAW